MAYQKIIVDKLENSSPKNSKNIYAWCEVRGRKGYRQCKWINIEICKKHSQVFDSLYTQCFGCYLWHDFLPQITEKRTYKKIITKMKHKKIKIKGGKEYAKIL